TTGFLSPDDAPGRRVAHCICGNIHGSASRPTSARRGPMAHRSVGFGIELSAGCGRAARRQPRGETMGIVRWLRAAVMWALLPTLASMTAKAADAPVIESILDRSSGAVVWSAGQPGGPPSLKPGQAIVLKGRNFGPGPLTMARPGLRPPAGGLAPTSGQRSIR